jgi:hypothetical protein
MFPFLPSEEQTELEIACDFFDERVKSYLVRLAISDDQIKEIGDFSSRIFVYKTMKSAD